MPIINVWDRTLLGKNYFSTAKCAVYGRAFLQGEKYKELQKLLNDGMRKKRGPDSAHPYLRWKENAPSGLPSLYHEDSFKLNLQPFIELTWEGKERLQGLLVDRFGNYQEED